MPELLSANVLSTVEADVRNRFRTMLTEEVPAEDDWRPGFLLNQDIHATSDKGADTEMLAIPDRSIAAVVWEWAGVHVGSIFGEAPTGRRVVARGITLVRSDSRDEFPDGVSIQSIVDWLGVATQVGLQLNGRSTRIGASILDNYAQEPAEGSIPVESTSSEHTRGVD